jgi:hypothetical protein
MSRCHISIQCFRHAGIRDPNAPGFGAGEQIAGLRQTFIATAMKKKARRTYL